MAQGREQDLNDLAGYQLILVIGIDRAHPVIAVRNNNFTIVSVSYQQDRRQRFSALYLLQVLLDV